MNTATVKMTLMRQKDRSLLHAINMSGQSQTGYFDPIPMRDIQIEVAGEFKKAETVRNASDLPVHVHAGYTQITLPELKDYELVVLR